MLEKIVEKVAPKSEAVDSAISYGLGGGAIFLAKIAEFAEPLALIIGCGVVVLRFIYDAIRLYRLWKNK